MEMVVGREIISGLYTQKFSTKHLISEKFELVQMAQKHTVRIWSTSGCPWCHKTKEWLKARNIEFTDINVDSDQKAAAEMIEKSGQRGVPVIEIDGKKIIIGFNEPALKKALEIP